jgi:hypothetical protein
MNTIRNISAVLLLSSLALTALPAGAVSFDSFHFLDRKDAVGESFIPLRPINTHFCSLSKVAVEETDTGNESARCELSIQNGFWFLSAILGRTSDADVFCGAVCYSN